MRRAYIRFCSFLLAFVLCACGSQSPSSGGDDAGQSTPSDLPSTLDAPLPDAPSVLDDTGAVVRPDRPVVTPDDVQQPPGCVDDAACVGDPGGPVCDTQARRCVPCTPASDRCPAGQYCVAEMNRCAPGCRDDASCAGGGSGNRCRMSTRQCVQCVNNDHCAAGTLCVGNICVEGCTPSHACPTGQTCCANACVDTQSSTQNCGACMTRCAFSNAAPRCTSGVCGIETCTAPYANCDDNAANGCETNTATDIARCGGCGTACESRPNTLTSCEGGACRYACAPNFADCDGNPANGCEANLATSPAHCGGCGRGCNVANATASCTLGACVVGTCNVGFGDCNRNAADGCEADLRVSVTHCGMCGRSCTLTNATPLCSAGACVVGACGPGYGDCDGAPASGCETPLSTTTNCGACGRVCPAPSGPRTVARCVSAGGAYACGAACESGWIDCDANLTNGCEAMGSCLVDRELFYDGFENGGGRWTFDSVWRVEPNGFIDACVGSYYLAAYLRPQDEATGIAHATMVNPIDISRATTLRLSHTTRSDSNSTSRFSVGVSTDGGLTWSRFASQSVAACGVRSVDLSDFVGRSSMLIRFTYYWDRLTDRHNWRIDEVRVHARVRNY